MFSPFNFFTLTGETGCLFLKAQVFFGCRHSRTCRLKFPLKMPVPSEKKDGSQRGNIHLHVRKITIFFINIVVNRWPHNVSGLHIHKL